MVSKTSKKDLLSGATDRQIGSDVSCKSSETTKVFWKKKSVFRTNFEEVFERTATDLD